MYPGTQPSMEIPILSGSVSVSESGLDSQLDTDTDPDTDSDGNDGLFPSKHEHEHGRAGGRGTIGGEEQAMITAEQKRAILDELSRTLAEMIETALRAAEAAREGMIVGSERTRTRGERGQFNEQAYLIGAQMKQVEEYQALQRELAQLDLAPARKVRPGSLVTVRAADVPPSADSAAGAEQGLVGDAGAPDGLALYFLVPGGMGLTVAVDGRPIQLVSPDSPLGQALIGRRPGTQAAVKLPAGTSTLLISAVD
jgi:hypothetical protein